MPRYSRSAIQCNACPGRRLTTHRSLVTFLRLKTPRRLLERWRPTFNALSGTIKLFSELPPRPHQMKTKKTEIDRSAIMRAVKSADTEPEMAVRRLAHSLGYRFRLHHKSLPGKPDLVFPRLRKVVFVHGCFWHGHNCARGDRTPKSNRDYWIAKIARNRERDQVNQALLRAQGWEIFIAWECRVKSLELKDELRVFLASPSDAGGEF
jgi:DNA mismatch endonuclease, patch repair protein